MAMNTPEAVAFAPATVANLGPGFDVLGLALDRPGDTVVARRVPGSGPAVVSIEVEGDGGCLPKDPAKNTAGIAALATLEAAGADAAVALTLRKGMPIGSGLGSSAASAAAAACAVNALIGGPLRRGELIAPCIEAEAVIAGRHADNVTAAVLGGLILVRSIDPLDYIRLPTPAGLSIAVVTPAIEVSTHQARAALPDVIPKADVVRHAADLAAMVAALYGEELDLLGRCLGRNFFAGRRLEAIPGGAAALDAALDAGAIGGSVSGSGPSLFALCHSSGLACRAATAMTKAFAAVGLTSETVVSPVDCPGVRLLRDEGRS